MTEKHYHPRVVHKSAAPSPWAKPEAVQSEAPAAPPPQVAAASAGGNDKDRINELNGKVSVYQAKPAPDNQTRLDIAHIVAVSNDEVRAISGTPNGNIGGLQGPRIPGAGVGR
jgi:hypothetical protein